MFAKARNGRDRHSAEEDEFPILCEVCLGPNPLIRMTKQAHGSACKICERPFCVYRWQPAGGRYKRTELCRTCAKIKNVCQTCVLDLRYGLPVQVRDTALGEIAQVELPKSDVGRAYALEQIETKMENGEQIADYEKTNPMLQRMQRREPYYDRNRAKLCSFFARGACNRGKLCPFRHEMPNENKELAKQNIKDRYHGVNDPVALKIMRRHNNEAEGGERIQLTLPDDKTITTLWVGNLTSDTSEQDLRAKFDKYGELTSVKVIDGKHCAFVTFRRRASAEEAAVRLVHNCNIKGNQCRIQWGKRLGSAPSSSSSSSSSVSGNAAALNYNVGSNDAPPGMSMGSDGFAALPSYVPPPPGMGSTAYASQDPNNEMNRFN